MRAVVRFLLLVAMMAGLSPAAHADDISAAARGVVRIVTIAVIDDEVVGFGHGSGFAVAPNRIITNAHVVEAAARYPGNVIIGIVPSEGDKSYQGKLIAYDQSRDLAMIAFEGVRLPPLTLYTGPVADGDEVVSLGYPGNVDLATARSATDYITPLTPVRSQGNYSGRRVLTGTQVLLHTASIARGNSGGPLLDPCGRVLGVNSALTRADEGDASFGFAIADSELASFLREAGQAYRAVGVGCTSMRDQAEYARLAEERDAAAQAAADRARDAQAAEKRDAALERARAALEARRENYMAIAALLLVLGALSIGAGGLIESRGQRREAIWAAAAGGVLIAGAVAAFLMRPGFDPSELPPEAMTVPDATPAVDAPLGELTCRILPELSRITVSTSDELQLRIGDGGCINGNLQYGREGDGWDRVLVPEDDQTVSVLEFDPARRRYTNSRYFLSAAQMDKARKLRAAIKVKQCTRDPAERKALAEQQQAIREALPELPNERLVYRCGAK